MKRIFIFVYFLSICFFISCQTKRVAEKNASKNFDNTIYDEQNVAVPDADNFLSSFNIYLAPKYEMAAELNKVKSNYLLLKKYAFLNKCDTENFFVINMRIPCYKKRFFIYYGKKDSIINSGFVAHGV